ncbi:hypothetical protein [Paraclostridium bifermentans]|uniref:hypothetical protein n=1 Tax=Paraclostridium bifermentans TaxID=1490 RepID=UPI0012E11AEE|nr:hypothetical protein [Paraclostridium bifermentans]
MLRLSEIYLNILSLISLCFDFIHLSSIENAGSSQLFLINFSKTALNTSSIFSSVGSYSLTASFVNFRIISLSEITFK